MRSIIMISDSKQSIEEITKYWKKNATQSNNLGNNRFSLMIAEGRVYFNYMEDGRLEYEDYELEEIKLDKYFFYSIAYSDIEALNKFILQTEFYGELYIDDDYGNIIKYEEFYDSFDEYAARFSNEI